MRIPALFVLGLLFLFGLTFAATYEATRDAGCVPSPDGSFGTIQEAVDAASDGDTVIVCNDGWYVENVVVDVPINLFGDSEGVPVVALSNTIPVINVSASDVNISNFTVSGSHGTGPFACGLLIRDAVDVRVRDFTATDNRIGVCVYDRVTQFVYFDGLTSYSNDYADMILGNMLGTMGPTAVYIADSSFYSSRYGIWLNRTDIVHINDSAFYNIDANPATSPGGSVDTSGIVARSMVTNLAVHNNQFYDNYVGMGAGCDPTEIPCDRNGTEVLIGAEFTDNYFGNHGLASFLADVDGTADHHWVIRNNTFDGTALVHFYADDLRNSTIEGNSFTRGEICMLMEGSSWVTFDSNTADQCFFGMVFYDGNRHHNLTRNNFTENYFNFGFMALDPMDYYHNISTDNLVNGVPIYYFVEGSTSDGYTGYDPVPVQVGYLGIISTDNAILQNMWDVGHNVNGVVILNSSNVSLSGFRVLANFWGAYLGLYDSTVEDFIISDSQFRGISGSAASAIKYPNCGALLWGDNVNFTDLLLNDHEICYYMAFDFGPPTGGALNASNFTISFTHPNTERPLSGMANYRNFQFTGDGGVSYLIREDIDFLTSMTKNLAIGPDFISIDSSNPGTDPSFQTPANVSLLSSGCPSKYYYAAGFPEDLDSIVAGGEFTPNITMECAGGLSSFEVSGFSGYAVVGPNESDDGPDESKSISLDYSRLDCPENGVELTAKSGGDVLNAVEYRVLFNSLHYQTLAGKPGSYKLMLSAEGDYQVTARKSGYSPDSVEFTFELCEEEAQKHLSCVNSACVMVSGAGENDCSSDSECEPPPSYECVGDSECADAYFCDIPFGQSGGSCEPVTGDCGYATNHTWVTYECGSAANCPQCPGDKICVDNTCVLRDLQGPEEGFIGEKARLNATEDGGPCPYCDIEIEFPDGRKVSGKTDANGRLEVPLDLEGQYAISLLGPDGYRLKTITVDSLPIEPPVDEPTPTVVQDEGFPLIWLVLLLIAAILAIAYWRRSAGKKR